MNLIENSISSFYLIKTYVWFLVYSRISRALFDINIDSRFV
jgi:hypothetical protein